MRVALLDDFSPLIQQTLSNWNWQVINGKNWSLKDYKKNASQLEGIIIRSKFPLSEEHLLMAKKLKFIGRPGSGLENIDLKTLQSKIVTDLYFAGEVLDIDGITGGYNFQSAWSTGFIAGKLAGKFY